MYQVIGDAAKGPDMTFDLVREVIQEEQRLNRFLEGPGNTCALRNICKNFIRRLRGFSQVNYRQTKCLHIGET